MVHFIHKLVPSCTFQTPIRALSPRSQLFIWRYLEISEFDTEITLAEEGGQALLLYLRIPLMKGYILVGYHSYSQSI